MAPEFDLLKMKVSDGVATVMLNRLGRMNTLNVALRDEIERCLDFLETHEETGAVVLTGGEENFSTGFDIEEVVATDLDSFTHRILEYHLKIYGFPKPIVSALSGFALAGGFDLALCRDVIIASETAIFGHPEVRFGVNPLVSPLWRQVGPAKAVEIAMTGETINAEEARRIGLVAGIVPPERVMEEALGVAKKLARIDTRALAAVKRAGMVVPRLDMHAQDCNTSSG